MTHEYEEAWLIEPIKQTGLNGPEYWGRDDDEDCCFSWTSTLANAMRFLRKQDAEAMIEMMGWIEAHAVDHQIPKTAT